MAHKVKVKSHARSAPDFAAFKKPKPATPPFKKGKGGYFAHGSVHEARRSEDGKSMHVTVRHGKLKTGRDGIFSSYDRESRLHLPMEAAKHFHAGQAVTMHIKKSGAPDNPTGDPNNET